MSFQWPIYLVLSLSLPFSSSHKHIYAAFHPTFISLRSGDLESDQCRASGVPADRSDLGSIPTTNRFCKDHDDRSIAFPVPDRPLPPHVDALLSFIMHSLIQNRRQSPRPYTAAAVQAADRAAKARIAGSVIDIGTGLWQSSQSLCR
jgi:hypothetical protein